MYEKMFQICRSLQALVLFHTTAGHEHCLQDLTNFTQDLVCCLSQLSLLTQCSISLLRSTPWTSAWGPSYLKGHPNTTACISVPPFPAVSAPPNGPTQQANVNSWPSSWPWSTGATGWRALGSYS